MKALSNPLAIWTIAMLALLFPVPSLLAAPTADSAQISKLLDQVRIHSAEAVDDAATLESFSKSKLSWESHAVALSEIKGHVNELIRDFNKLAALRAEGSPWQQHSIDLVNPLLTKMAANLKATIEHLNANKTRVHMPQYQNYVRANLELLDKTHNLISDLIDYDKAKDKAEGLQKDLALPNPPPAGL